MNKSGARNISYISKKLQPHARRWEISPYKGVGDILRVDKGMTANLHSHGFEEPDAKGCQGYKWEEGITNEVEQPIV